MVKVILVWATITLIVACSSRTTCSEMCADICCPDGMRCVIISEGHGMCGNIPK